MSQIKGVPLQLKSNILHPYDYCFSRSAPWFFLRMYHTIQLKEHDFLRREIFQNLEKMGIETVPNGTVEQVLQKIDPAHGLIVYTDERAHRGEGKLWVSAKEAQEKYPQHWCSVCVPPLGQSIRHFQFGDLAFTMPFYSKDDWRSNRGQSVSYCIPGSRWNMFPKIPFPYFALDFIPGTDMVTDFQLVPGIENDRLDNWMRPRQMYQALQRAAAVLIEQGRAQGSLKGGYGLVHQSELEQHPNWEQDIGEFLRTTW